MKPHKIEIFSANCPLCEETIELINSIATSGCEITVLDMNQKIVSAKAKKLGIKQVPAVSIDGKLADCCSAAGPQIETLKKLIAT